MLRPTPWWYNCTGLNSPKDRLYLMPFQALLTINDTRKDNCVTFPSCYTPRCSDNGLLDAFRALLKDNKEGECIKEFGALFVVFILHDETN